MKVYLALLSYDHSEDEVVGVHSTERLAERRAKQARQVYPCAHVRVVGYEVDGPATWEPTPPTGEGGGL